MGKGDTKKAKNSTSSILLKNELFVLYCSAALRFIHDPKGRPMDSESFPP
jgi:hypothetical protein